MQKIVKPGLAVRALRKAMGGITLLELSRDLGVTLTTVHRCEKGNNFLRNEQFSRLVAIALSDPRVPEEKGFYLAFVFLSRLAKVNGRSVLAEAVASLLDMQYPNHGTPVELPALQAILKKAEKILASGKKETPQIESVAA